MTDTFTFENVVAGMVAASTYPEITLRTSTFALGLLALVVPNTSHATVVYPGCSAPSSVNGHHIFYVDPVKGSKSGDGSSAKPWHTLAEVLDRSSSLVATKGYASQAAYKAGAALVDVNSKGPIKPGDVILLMSGDHGTLTIQNNRNSEFITVMAAPGQTPTVRHMAIVSSSKWMFQGIKFQDQEPNPNPNLAAHTMDGLVTVGTGDWLGPSTDAIFASNSFSSTDNTSSWSASDWIMKPYYIGFSAANASCISVVSNQFNNLLNASALAGPSVKGLFQGNIIQHFSNDGLEIAGSDLLIKGNQFTNGVNNAAVDPLHADGIQGWSNTVGGVIQVNNNVTLDSNIILKFGDPAKTYLQGISIFNGKWNNLAIQNNAVLTNTYNGITVFGAQNSRIVNNTVVATAPTVAMTWLRIAVGDTGVHTSNLIVRNNILPTLGIEDTGVTYDHNLMSGRFAALVNGKAVNYSVSQTGTQNLMNSSVASIFTSLNLATQTYNLRPQTSSPAVGAGVAMNAPTTDILGQTRKNPFDLGAYAH